MRTKYIQGDTATDLAVTGRRLLLGAALGASLAAFGLAGCHSNAANTTNPADGTAAASDPNAADPAAANMAPVDNSTQVAGIQQAGQPSQQGYENTTPAPIERRTPTSASSGQSYSEPNYNQGSNDQGSSDQGYNDQGYNDNQDYNAEQGYAATLSDIQAPQPPPPMPEYAQPVAPDPNYLWTPGYWSYAPTGYYWVPGAWVQAPYTGALWTPGYWGGYGNGYRFHHGFWAAHIGFYGGINYGFGYVGTGYQGGYWNGNNFYYNRYANHIDDSRIHNVYQRNVVVNNTVINNRVVNNTTYNNTTINNIRINNVSYNGGRGGIAVQPRPAELAVLREQRTPPMQAQLQQRTLAAKNPQQFYSRNQGKPAEFAAARPLAADHGITPPAHTTAQINRAEPVKEQLRQQQMVFHPQAQQPQTRPVGGPAAQPNGGRPGQPVNRTEPANQPNRPGAVTQPTRPGQPVNRPGQVQQARPTTPQLEVKPQQGRPQPQQARPQPAARPQQQPAARPQQQARPAQPVRPQQEAVKPQPATRPQPQQHQARPQPQQQARPQPQQQARPQSQARPQPQQARPQPQAHPQNNEAHKPESHR